MSFGNPLTASMSISALIPPQPQHKETVSTADLGEPTISDADLDTMKRWASRYLFENNDGTMDPEMSRMSSFICFDVAELEQELEKDAAANGEPLPPGGDEGHH
eukprot:4258226-Amphidinium_carterae.1